MPFARRLAPADVVLTFRNVHNWMLANPPIADQVFAQAYQMLKPGGVLGVVDHRLPEEMDTAKEKSSGYIKRSTVVRLAEQAGFRLAGESNVNANPRDTHDHPEGLKGALATAHAIFLARFGAGERRTVPAAADL